MARADEPIRHETTQRFANEWAIHALRASLSTSLATALLLISGGLIGSWAIVFLAGGAERMVPHWYYLPIIFTAARFGMAGTFCVALAAGVLAGPLTCSDVITATPQPASQWLSRTGFFLGIGLLMSWLLTPSLTPINWDLRRVQKEFAIRRALANGEFFLRYQPIYACEAGSFAGAEALIRWQHPTKGELSPEVFIRIAEDSSLICNLTDFVLNEACRQAAEWRALALRHDKAPWFIAINISGHDLKRPDIVQQVSHALDRYELPPELLHIELTESILLLEDAVSQLSRLKQLGVNLIVDDFGTGYSSLSYLHRYPVDALKIDRSLIADLRQEPASQALAKGIVGLAASLGLRTIAEGLESEEQLRIGRALNIDYVQGYYFARPRKPAEVIRLIAKPKRA